MGFIEDIEAILSNVPILFGYSRTQKV
ncbi:hypothetical protein CGLO_06739 [Colletotrichum gloeosporioides Cg-14]|uniref:Uncharacterized protein n=1 Tax=Colletotrichum gloeosporioides (strain Cg-14) TaxID=1237896 RepID=T0LYJ2_COLGC|nr:hypothetical protein CGLO_06739 [Colletotrichum gloeosporioides Cg-14]